MADNITHGLAAALLAQAGLRQRYGAIATVALVIGAELPDIDALFDLGGAVFGFVHHRGITHSFLGSAGLALLGAGLLWQVWRRWQAQPYWRIAWLLYLGMLLHIGMDYVTPYGTQVLLPFDAGHYTSDTLFIIDLTYSALMIMALLLVRMVRCQRQPRYARASLLWIALGAGVWYAAPALAQGPLSLLAWRSGGLHVLSGAAIIGFLAWTGRTWQARHAVRCGQVGVGLVLGYFALCVLGHRLAQYQMLQTLGAEQAAVHRLAALPLPGGGPLFWRVIAETETTYVVSRVALVAGKVSPPQYIAKGPDNQAIQAASHYRLVRVFQDFARFPVVAYHEHETATMIRYVDLRFVGDGRERSWFNLTVWLDQAGQVQVIEFLNRLFHPNHPEF